MNSSLRRCVVGAGVLALSFVVHARSAHAAGFAAQRFGGEQGTVVATNPTALYYNPGGLGFSDGSQLGLYGTLAIRHASYAHQDSPNDIIKDPPDAQGASTGKNSLLNVFGGPSLAGSLKLGNLVIGGGFFAPFYGRAHWSKNDAFANSAKYPLAADGVQRWFAVDGAISVLYFSAGAAYRIGPFSIGAAGNVISTTISDTHAKNPTGSGLPDTSDEGRAETHVSGWNGSFAVGAMLEIVPKQLWFGASYQAEPGLGEQTLSGTLDIRSSQFGKPRIPPVSFTQTLPDIWRAGFRWKPKESDVELRLFGDWTRWSVFAAQCIFLQTTTCATAPDGSDIGGSGIQQKFVRDWHDSYGVRVGLSGWVKRDIELFTGAGFETAAVPDATMGADLFDADNIALSLGGRFRLSESLFLTASYTHIQYLNRDNTGKSDLSQVPGPNGVPMQVAYPTIGPDGGGQYTQWIGTFNGNLEAIF